MVSLAPTQRLALHHRPYAIDLFKIVSAGELLFTDGSSQGHCPGRVVVCLSCVCVCLSSASAISVVFLLGSRRVSRLVVVVCYRSHQPSLVFPQAVTPYHVSLLQPHQTTGAQLWPRRHTRSLLPTARRAATTICSRSTPR